jgi:uncharacterized RDD family membrane protein YckC
MLRRRRPRQGKGRLIPAFPGRPLETAPRRSDVSGSIVAIEEGGRTMFDSGGEGRFYSRGGLPRPLAPREALAGVRTRRILALFLDLFLVGALTLALWVALLVLSFGLSALLLPPLFPLVAFFYNGLTVSGWRRATPGMRSMDLEERLMNGEPAPFLNAAVHGVLFYVSWLFPPLLLVTFVTADKRCLHDILADVIILRRSA